MGQIIRMLREEEVHLVQGCTVLKSHLRVGRRYSVVTWDAGAC